MNLTKDKNTSLSTKKKIAWVTPDYFIDCDYNTEILSNILEDFDIHWLILLPATKSRYSEDDFTPLQKLKGIKVEFIYWNCRARDPRTLLFYEKVYKRIKALNADLIYFNYVPTNPYILPLYKRLTNMKSVVTAHDGNVKSSFTKAWISRHVFDLAFSKARYVNMFSRSEAAIFKSTFTKAKVFIIPLSLKSFGKSTAAKRTDNIIFLFFGSIISNKNLDLFIDAACNLYEQGTRGFKVAIHGFCSNWDEYKSRIKYPDIFECDIRMHENSEIPDLLAQSHYMVFPYKEVSQSGALKVAFNYEVPAITSDLPAFVDEVKEGINGYTFKRCDVKDLERVMRERLKVHTTEYGIIQQRISAYNNAEYAPQVLAQKYKDMFDDVLSSK